MNRLILIGNGFDLAHGLKTSYKDFIASYFSNAINRIYLNRPYEDELIQITLKRGQYYQPLPNDRISTENSLEKFREILNGTDIFDLMFKSLVLKNSFQQIESMNWVDLEIEYFKVLLATKYGYKNNDQLEAIQKVNTQFDFLKEKLKEYLLEQEASLSTSFDLKPLVDCFTEPIQAQEVVTTNLSENQKPENLFFLNFNYTHTFEPYFDACRAEIPSEFDYIHGDLQEQHGSMIFGFGDELDKNYLEFEDEKNNELFKHIKSFEYLKNKNYYRLIRFIESGDFQVQIYGHSCGLSDRTMLNQIFEHQNCKSIKMFYHQKPDGTNDYTEKTYEISRHFKDKGMMRKKIVPFDYCRPMPQPKIE
ncbi:hypothetical protein KIH23_11750 [Flavobacterium sp. CYK-55]|uniref:AbiH family protein n=1 Tax=Flavobacterium sp. CYK-55 TaxID=2835529 RepID=UPI001BCCF3E6|nr:AbiH family protein [Flavobacterium sp. CYK-55]MBS7787971.1 hypothetical protein [Flavobacterium sp. CYK-55]